MIERKVPGNGTGGFTPEAPRKSEERLPRTRSDETSVGTAREIGFEPGEFRREEMNLAAVSRFRIGQSWSRLL